MDNAHHWDAVYRAHAAPLPWEQDALPPELERWAGRLADDAQILDVGCGRGTHACTLASAGWRVSGLDASPTAIEAAHARARASGTGRARFTTGNVLSLRPEPKFDLVYDYSVLHHIEPGDRARYATAISAACRPGGLVGIVCYAPTATTPDPDVPRIGGFGNPIFHPDRETVFRLFASSASLVEHGRSRLGAAQNHHAHHFLFRNTASDSAR
jgi:SAM-dependent methyltransferase